MELWQLCLRFTFATARMVFKLFDKVFFVIGNSERLEFNGEWVGHLYFKIIRIIITTVYSRIEFLIGYYVLQYTVN